MDEPIGVASEPRGSASTKSRTAAIILLVLFWLWLGSAAWGVAVMAALGAWGCAPGEPCEGLFLGALGANVAVHLVGGVATSVWGWRSASTAGAIAKYLVAAIALPAAAFGIVLILFE